MATKPNIELILVKSSGTAILTLALLRLPDTFRALAQLISALAYRSLASPEGEAGALITKLNQSFISSAVGDLLAFVVLLLLARWMFGFPRVVKSLFRRADDNDKAKAEQGGGADVEPAV